MVLVFGNDTRRPRRPSQSRLLAHGSSKGTTLGPSNDLSVCVVSGSANS